MNKDIVVLVAIMVSLAGCGGGGGSATAAITPTPAPPAAVPTMTLSMNSAKASVGVPVTLTWSSTGATSCTASGAWTGTQPISGSLLYTPTTAGASSFALSCTGAGGTANQTAALTVPFSVQKSSYENKIAAAAAIGPQSTSTGNAIAYADFFQDGTMSMVTHNLVYNNQDPTTATKFGSIQLWKKVNGAWMDKTSTVLPDPIGCLHPRKAIVADFNGDGMPDVFFACHGFDASPYAGEKQHILLSQKDGAYKNVTLPLTCFCHSASAADINGDGYPDIVVTDTSVALTPYVMINNKDGTFTQDLNRLPLALKNRQIYSAELIDFDKSGKYDVWLSGTEPNSTQVPVDPLYSQLPTIYKNDGTGSFISTTPVVLPSDRVHGLALDINVVNNNVYLLRTSISDPALPYNSMSIQKIDYKTLASTTIYSHSGPYPQSQYYGSSTWFDWIIPYQGKIVSMNAAFGVTVAP